MRLRTIPIAIAATLALLVLPASALAEYLVPEGNSAVTQYTEGFPTGGGEKKAEGTNKKGATPAKTIGAANTKKLETHGQEGTEVAEVAAETAPEIETSESSGQDNPSKGKGQKDGKQGKPAKKDKPASNDSKQDEGSATPPPSQGDGPSGSSGPGEVLGAATGASSGSLGLLLPLVILAAIAWGIAFFFRQRRRDEPAAAAKP